MLDETEIIRIISGAFSRLPRGYSQIGDDVAIVPATGRRLLMKVDMLVGKTDVPTGMTYRQAARKTVAMCVSDFAAKGARPDSFMVSLGLRRGLTVSQVRELAQGFKDASAQWNLKFVGGDTNEASDLVIGCSMVGFARSTVSRSTARPGDLVVTTGYFGYPPSGLKIMMGGAKASQSFRRRAVDSVVRPSPSLEAGEVLGGYLTSAIDSSDGLAISLYTFAEMSQVGMVLERLPARKDVESFARANDLSFEKLVLAGGEEYLIVGTVKENRFSRATRAARTAGCELLAIGMVTEKREGVVLRRGSKIEPIAKEGWTHLA